MSHAHFTSSSIVILLDPFNKHTTLDEDRYRVFRRFTTFNDVHYLIDTRQFEHIDLHVPTTFNFNDMRQHPKVYIHTYFVSNEEISLINDTEREKIRESIRICCENTGEEFIERGIMDSNENIFDEGIDLVEQILQMDINRMNRSLL